MTWLDSRGQRSIQGQSRPSRSNFVNTVSNELLELSRWNLQGITRSPYSSSDDILEVKGQGHTFVLYVCGGRSIRVDAGASKYIFWLPAASRTVHSTSISVTRVILRFFCPARVTCCTDWGEIWRGGVNRFSTLNFTPIFAGVWQFYQNFGINTPLVWSTSQMRVERHGSLLTFWRFTNRIIIIIIIIIMKWPLT